MEATLIYENMDGYLSLFSRLIQQEQIQDCVVPDTLPDIASLIVTTGTPLIRSKDLAFGRLRIEANLPARCAFYGEDGESYCLDVNLPFYLSIEQEAIGEDCRAVVSMTAEALETRVLNPRKLSLRGVVNFAVTVYSGQTRQIPVGAEAPEARLHGQTRHLTASGIREVTEKTFVVTDEVPFPEGVSAAELLGWQVSLHPGETKSVGTKLILKGTAESQVLYRTAAGDMVCSRFSTDYSQVAELQREPTAPTVQSTLLLSGQYFEILPGREGRTLALELHLVAELTVYDRTEPACLSDVYSNLFTLHLKKEAFPLLHAGEETSVPQTVRLSLPLPQPPSGIIGCLTAPASVRKSDTEAVGAVRTAVLWSDGAGRVHSEQRVAEFPCGDGADVGPGGWSGMTFPAAAVSETADGVTAELETALLCCPLTAESVEYVAAVSFEEEDRRDPEQTPSLVLVRAEAGTDLWELAKENCSTVEAIERANQGAAPTETHRFLLIPRSI